MASRFALTPVPRWRYGEDYLALLDSLEAALPLARASRLSDETMARAIFVLSEGPIYFDLLVDRISRAHGFQRAKHTLLAPPSDAAATPTPTMTVRKSSGRLELTRRSYPHFAREVQGTIPRSR